MQGALFETNIKYKLLDTFLSSYLSNVKYSSEIKIYIDLKTLFKKVYRRDIDNIFPEQKLVIEDIVSHILNMIGFYRNYFYKNKKYTTFYLLYSNKECSILKNIYPDYKKEYYQKYIYNEDEYKNLNNIIKSVSKQLQILCKYIPHVYYINTSLLDEFCYLNYLIRHSGNSLNLLLSSDPILYQTLDSSSIALDLKGENSSLITNKNVISYLSDTKSDFTSNSLNIIFSIIGNKEYSISNIPNYSYKKTLKILSLYKNDGAIIDKTYMKFPEELFSNETFKTNKDMILNNFNIIFPIEIQMKNEEKIEEVIIKSQMKNETSLLDMEELNKKIFNNFPINMTFLLKGELI